MHQTPHAGDGFDTKGRIIRFFEFYFAVFWSESQPAAARYRHRWSVLAPISTVSTRVKACDKLGVKNVGLYGGTKHTVAIALGALLTPEEIKRGGTGSRTNKAFDRYFQPQRQDKLKVKSAIQMLKGNARDGLIAENDDICKI